MRIAHLNPLLMRIFRLSLPIMTSGIIYLLIVGMWVAYFVPRWVHSHDEFSGKSVERYKSAMRTVAGSASTSAHSSNLVHTEYDHESHLAQVLLRRRIIFGLLSVIFLFTIFQSLLGNVSLIYSFVPVSGLAIYVAHVRRQGLIEKLQLRRVTQLHKFTDGISKTNLSPVVSPKESRDHWVPLAEREISGVVILPKGSAPARNAWQPNSVPVPTYVNAPKAVVPKRTLDLTVPGAWLDEQEKLAQEVVAAGAPTRDEVFDQQLAEEAVERLRQNRAANQ